jgi:hypothetical protein
MATPKTETVYSYQLNPETGEYIVETAEVEAQEIDFDLVEYGYTAPFYWVRDVLQTKRFFTQRKFLAYLAVERMNGKNLRLVGKLPAYKRKKK